MKKVLFLLPFIILLFISGTTEARKKKYPNGDYYEGKWKKGTPHGFGTMKYANGNIYVGNWEYGKYSGEGEIIYKSGTIYKYSGSWSNNLRHGYGEMEFYNGDRYKGQFNMSKITGEGVMTYRSYDVYSGSWVNGLRSGLGKLTCHNGDVYEGIWKDDVFYQGKATIDNIIYEGEFFKGSLLKGTQKNPNGSWFEGEWHNEKFMNGKCLITNEDYRFEGEVKNGEYYNGTGKHLVNSDYYEGKWENGNFTGKCTLKEPRKGIKQFNGEKTSDSTYVGLIIFSNGSYNGELTNDFRLHGKGTIALGQKEQLKLNGTWNNGRIINGTGRFICNAQEYQATINLTEDTRKIDLTENQTSKKISIEIPDTLLSDTILLSWASDAIKKERHKTERLFFFNNFNDKGFVYVEDPYTPFLPFTKAVKFYRLITFASSENINIAVIPFLDKKMMWDMGRDNAVMAYALASKGLKNEFHQFEVIDNIITFDNKTLEYNPTNKSLKDEDGKIYKLMSTSKSKEIIENGLNSLKIFK